MEPTIITRKFLLAGYEAAIDLNEEFSGALADLREKLRHMPGRPIGFWTGDPAVDYSDAKNHSRRVYFFGVEIASAEDAPAGSVVRDFPESQFALFREERRGTAPKWEWLAASTYTFNSEAVPGDFEIFDDIFSTAPDCPCDILVPIKPDKK